MKLTLRLVSVALCAWIAFAVETRTWSQNEQSDFENATLKGIALRSDGQLTLSPVVKELYDAAIPYLWAVAQDSKGAVYAAGGGPGGSNVAVYRVDAVGAGSKFAELDGLEIHALAVDKQDRIYAATSPNGKVWRIGADKKPQLFYDPKATYIWAMAFAADGSLFVATGDKGEIHKVGVDGKGAVFHRLEDAHARSMAMDAKGNLYLGTEPSGVIVRVSPAGESFILHQTSKREVTSVIVAQDGKIYAAATGSKQGPTVLPSLPLPVAAPAAPAPPNAPAARPTAVPLPVPSATVGISGGAEVVQIDPDGAPRKIWSHATDVAYALGFDSNGALLVGTGNKGSVYRIDSPVKYTLLLSSGLGQVTGFTSAQQGAIYAVTGNVGRVLRIGPGLEPQGTIESDVLDAGSFSYWGRLHLDGAATTIETRSGNVDRPQKSWSTWAPLKDGRVVSPAARFLQWRATMKPTAGKSPELSGVDVAWMAKNLAPRIEEIEATPANYRFPQPTNLLVSSAQTLSLPPLGRKTRSSGGGSLEAGSSVVLTYAKGSSGLRWLAVDDNGDDLLFKVEIRGVAETSWKLLKDKIRERYLTFDSTAFPDGEYVARVTASDSPDNPPADALSGDLVSSSFLIDNSAPAIESLTAQPSGSRIQLRFKAKDTYSWISKAEYSLNGVEWLTLDPVTRLSDSKELDYSLLIDRPQPGELTIAVRVTDDFDNQSVSKVVVK